MCEYEYFKPDSLTQLLEYMDERPDAAAMAGGTDLMVRLRAGKAHAKALVDLLIPELMGIEESADAFIIRAATSLTDVSDYFKALPQPYRMLQEAVDTVGSCLTRNLATIAGNFCTGSASSDLATALLALDASVKIQKKGSERFLLLADFFIRNRVTALEPGELVTAVHIPKTAFASAGAAFVKVGKRRGHVIAILNAAALVGRGADGQYTARFAAGTLAHVPLRLYRSEEEFVRCLARGRSAEQALESVSRVMLTEIDPRDSQRASKEYRQAVGPVALCRAITGALGDGI